MPFERKTRAATAGPRRPRGRMAALALCGAVCVGTAAWAGHACEAAAEAAQVERDLAALEAHGDRFAAVIAAVRAERARPPWQFADPVGASADLPADCAAPGAEEAGR